jgi:hypothetical protein
VSITIENQTLEKACKGMIETILYCLPQAYKGTIYRIGGAPDLIATRVTSGYIDQARETISWGLPESSEYNPPGRPWVDYRDEPNRPLEAMAWCVERQKSWTAEDPLTDARSVRLQVDGVWEDYHHMEPVLVRKVDLNYNIYSVSDSPLTWDGKSIWKDSEYVVVAVIKIHFQPRTIRIGTHETKVIKKLSRALGTELLSYQFRKDSMEAMQALASDRLKACNILADSLRNAITKTGLIFSLVKQEMGFLRDQWEEILQESRHETNGKREAVLELNRLLAGMEDIGEPLRNDLIKVQNRFLELSLPPEMGDKWVSMQIEERWRGALTEADIPDERKAEVYSAIERLKESLRYGCEPGIISGYNKLPQPVKDEWVDLLYQHNSSFDSTTLERLIRILDNPGLEIPSRDRSRRNLTQLKALAETMNNLERNTNFLLRQVLNGKNGSKAHELSVESGSFPLPDNAGGTAKPETVEKDARL